MLRAVLQFVPEREPAAIGVTRLHGEPLRLRIAPVKEAAEATERTAARRRHEMMFLRLCRRSPEKTDFSLYIPRLLCFLSGTQRSARSPARCARIPFSFYFIIHIFISFVNTKRRICAASGGAFASFTRRPSRVEPGFRTRSCRRCTWSRNEQLFFTVPRAGERIATSRFLGIAPRNDTRLCV